MLMGSAISEKCPLSILKTEFKKKKTIVKFWTAIS